MSQTHHLQGCLIYVEMVQGKVWVQRDETENSVTNDLLAAGTSKEAIVLGFHEPALLNQNMNPSRSLAFRRGI
ncbi:MAG: XisI protein [Timaviella obliquedivisa GSE-PSE-MK23-08B]|jgi:hypothetical protein|nr:XisI protein [Timaviella obliquedivisa GSE-PSE-MK23-08B]